MSSVVRKVAKKIVGKKTKAVKKPKKKDFKTRDKMKFKKNYEVQEGMGLDPITGRGVRAASDVDKGKAGKVTRSKEPGFLQSERTAGSRAKAQEKADLSKKVREGKATKEEKEYLQRLRDKDVMDDVRARAKGAQTARGKSKKEPDDFATAINRKTGEINEAAFNRLTKNQQDSLMRDIRARFSTGRVREIMARLDELEPTKAGETGVRRRRQGQTYGMRGAESKPKNIDDGVSKGRGGLDFNKGGVVKSRTGAHDYRMNKGGLLLSSVDNRKKR